MLKDLKRDVMDVLEENVEFLKLSLEEAAFAGYGISEKNPVECLRVPGGWRIVVVNTLSHIQSAEALGHELGHLLFLGEGLHTISFGYGDDWAEDYLAEEINSVTAHHFIYPRLEEDYGIDSSIVLGQRKALLHDGEEVIAEYSEEPIILHAIGLHLLDLAYTTTGKENRIMELTELSGYVRDAYLAGEEHLIYPEPNLPSHEQWQRVKNFLVRLGYDPGLARLIG